jgi:mono/diheme cytochrome c family protein
MAVDYFNKSLGKAVAFVLLAGLSLCFPLLHAADNEAVVAYTEIQATAGKVGYEEQCASCHGFNLEGFGLVPSLSGSYFAGRWGDTTADQLALDVQRMPPAAANSLGETTYTQILAYLLQQNGIRAN